MDGRNNRKRALCHAHYQEMRGIGRSRLKKQDVFCSGLERNGACHPGTNAVNASSRLLDRKAARGAALQRAANSDMGDGYNSPLTRGPLAVLVHYTAACYQT